MVIIKQFIKPECIELVLTGSYVNDFNSVYSSLRSLGFNYNKLRKTYSKSYFSKEYTEDRFNSDLEKIKTIWVDYKLEVYKMINEVKSYK